MSAIRALKRFFLLSVVPRLAYYYLSLVGATSRLTWHGDAGSLRLTESNRGFIYALWHARQAVLTYTHRGRGVSVLVSRSDDGGIIAEVLRLSGNGTVRGSSSRGGAAALKELVGAGREGAPLAVTPDGPRGPARQAQQGALFLARELGIPIVPGASGLKRKLVFNSWDELQFPLPFNRIAVVYGPPIHVGPDDDLEAKTEELRRALNAVTAEADRIAES